MTNDLSVDEKLFVGGTVVADVYLNYRRVSGGEPKCETVGGVAAVNLQCSMGDGSADAVDVGARGGCSGRNAGEGCKRQRGQRDAVDEMLDLFGGVHGTHYAQLACAPKSWSPPELSP